VSSFLQQFSAKFAQLNARNLDRLGELYAENVHFTDPLHEICGLAELHGYFAELYANLIVLDFAFFAFDEVREGEGYLRWIMSFRHPRLNQGQLISLEGCTMLRWNAAGKVVRHRDYFDAGALLYQHVPVVGPMIRWLHRRIA
jgi:hypothetical protein